MMSYDEIYNIAAIDAACDIFAPDHVPPAYQWDYQETWVWLHDQHRENIA